MPTKTIQSRGPSGETEATIAALTGATGVVDSYEIAEVATRTYDVVITWDDADPNNELLGDWQVTIGDIDTIASLGSDTEYKLAPVADATSGIHGLIATCQDQDENAVNGAVVRIAGTSLEETTTTLGKARFNVNNGDYTLIVAVPSGYETPDPVDVTVEDADEPVPITIQRVIPPVSENPEGCTVTVNVRNQKRAPIEGAKVRAETLVCGPLVVDALLLNTDDDNELTDENGQASIELAREVDYTIIVSIGYIEVRLPFTTPDAGSAVATAEL